MRIKKEGSENNPRFKMMEAGITLKEIEKWYGKATADALVQYCEINDKEIDQVAGSDREWDKFEMWAKSKKRGLGTNSGKFGDWQKASRIDDKGTGERAPKIYDRPVDSDIYGEGSGSGMSDTDIVNWIGEELEECEWVDDISYSDDIGGESAQVAIKVGDKAFIVSVEEDAGAAKQLLGWDEN